MELRGVKTVEGFNRLKEGLFMRTSILALLALAFSANAWATQATTIRQIDTIFNSTGGSSLAVPGTGTTLITDSATQTLTNKSISGASNTFSSIPVSAIATGTGLGVNAGGTGLTSATSNGILYGSGTSALGVTAAGSQYQVLQAGSGGVPAFAALALNQSAAVTGTLGVGNGGLGVANPTAGGVLVGAGSSAVSAVTCSNTGYVLTWGGSSWSCSAVPAAMPALNGTQASPQSVTAGGGISLSGLSYYNVAFIKASSSGTTTVTATPSITACTAAGQQLVIIGESSSNLVLLQDQSALSGSDLALNGNWTSGLNSVLSLICDGNSIWVEQSRQ
jgi:hypothetical protein